MLPPLLNTLGFKCNNTAYRPVMDAMRLLKKYADVDGKTRFYDAGDEAPMDGVVRKDWREAVVAEDDLPGDFEATRVVHYAAIR
ncbi:MULTISPECIES: hypothetical protein [unclassified Nonomuraea]|uniref:hypothetical protein n=1 Tax=unclassified Nonomuraea TaxID=2593643 RepID=UPI00340DFE70